MIPGVPYDAEIEYLESTGAQWIDTGYAPDTSTKIVIDFKLTGVFNNKFLFGSEVSWGNNAFALVFRATNSHSVEFGGDHRIVNSSVSGVRITATASSSGASIGTSSISYTGAITGNSYPIYLYGNNREGSLNTTIAAILYSVRLWNGSTLVRDFIPVRVGQTGYMYDRVTRRLFGNAGTGSFVLGPDVAKPVMGLWGMRKFTSVKDYVQDGLTNMWDGIDNAGGVHDMNATVWKDLAGNVNLPIASGGTWESDGLYCDGVNPGVATRTTAGNGCPYYECVFQILALSQRINRRIIHLRVLNTSYEKAVGCGYVAGVNNSFVINRRSDVPLDLKRHFASCGSTDKTIADPATLDNNPVTFLGNYGGGSFGTGIYMGCSAKSNTPIWQDPVNCRIFAFRMYNRVLTASETAHNYAIDKARFNLP